MGSYVLWDFKNSSKDYFEGNGHFSPTNGEVEYLIQAGIEGPTERQKEFYKDLQNDFEVYVQKIKPLIEDEFKNWKEDFQIENFNEEFKLVCITIPGLGSKPVIWDMTFTTVHDLDHQITIDFVDSEPNGIEING